MSSYRYPRDKKASSIRHVAVGIVVSIVSILLIIGAASLVFTLIESIARNAIAPIAFAALAFGCFVGGYTYGLAEGKNGIICGAIIGAAAAFLIIISGCFGDGLHIGRMAFIKLVG